MSWKPEVQTGTDPKWYGNSVAFATEKEALWSAEDLYHRWTLCTAFRAIESEEEVNYRIDWDTQEMVAVPKTPVAA
jgi:hypothetical protein